MKITQRRLMFCPELIPRKKLNTLKMEINLSQSIEEAVKLNSKYQETICLFAGSLYMVGEVLNLN